jgi:hypothetical protein
MRIAYLRSIAMGAWRMRLKLAVAALALAAMLGGCDTLSGYPKPAEDQTVVTTATEPAFASDVLNRYHSAAASDRGGLSQDEYRDLVVNARIRRCNAYYDAFSRELSKNRSQFNIASDAAVIALSQAGTVVSPANVKAILAAFSGGITGLRNSIDTDLFYSAAIPALQAQMDASRDEVYARIKAGLATPVARYSLDTAINDVDTYCRAGSLPYAIRATVKDAGAKDAVAQEKIEAVTRDVAYRDALPTIEGLDNRLNALSASQAAVLAIYMKQYIDTRSPAVKADLDAFTAVHPDITDEKIALRFLRYWFSHDDGSAASLAQWRAGLAKVEP